MLFMNKSWDFKTFQAHWISQKGRKQGLYNRWIGPRRETSALRSLCIKWNTVGGNGQLDLLAKHTQNCGGGRASWGLKEAGNSLSRNFNYRAVGPPPGRKHCTLLLSADTWRMMKTRTWSSDEMLRQVPCCQVRQRSHWTMSPSPSVFPHRHTTISSSDITSGSGNSVN
jgi:hypothetical protein